jgi:hypothetical protein
MAALAALYKFGKNCLDDWLLRVDKPLQIIRVVSTYWHSRERITLKFAGISEPLFADHPKSALSGLNAGA